MTGRSRILLGSLILNLVLAIIAANRRKAKGVPTELLKPGVLLDTKRGASGAGPASQSLKAPREISAGNRETGYYFYGPYELPFHIKGILKYPGFQYSAETVSIFMWRGIVSPEDRTSALKVLNERCQEFRLLQREFLKVETATDADFVGVVAIPEHRWAQFIAETRAAAEKEFPGILGRGMADIFTFGLSPELARRTIRIHLDTSKVDPFSSVPLLYTEVTDAETGEILGRLNESVGSSDARSTDPRGRAYFGHLLPGWTPERGGKTIE